MRLNYVGRRTLIAMGFCLVVALFASAMARPFSCSQLSPFKIERPTPPACVGTFPVDASNSLLVQSCKMELSDYADKMDQYSRCLIDENKEAVKEGNDMIERYNCIVRGSLACH